MSPAQHLVRVGACLQAREWAAQYPDMATAWERCQNPTWMMWLAHAERLFDPTTQRLLACALVRHTPFGTGTMWDKVDHPSRIGVQTSERYAEGLASEHEISVALQAIRDAKGFAWHAASAATQGLAWAAMENVLCVIPSAGSDMTRRAQADIIRYTTRNPFTP